MSAGEQLLWGQKWCEVHLRAKVGDALAGVEWHPGQRVEPNGNVIATQLLAATIHGLRLTVTFDTTALESLQWGSTRERQGVAAQLDELVTRAGR